jgi:hypothetical protein
MVEVVLLVMMIKPVFFLLMLMLIEGAGQRVARGGQEGCQQQN